MIPHIAAYHLPKTLDEALRLWRDTPDARFVAGGTDLLVRIRDGRERPGTLISLRRISDLRGIRLGPETVIGALTPVADIESDPELARLHPALSLAAAALGSTQIRNAATLGGNLCNASPCADLAPPLIVLDASLEVVGPKGTRRVAVEDFFTGPGETVLSPGEVVSAVTIPAAPPGSSSMFLKHGRVAMDLGLASVAVSLTHEDGRPVAVRAAAGAVAPRPWRLRAAEAAVLDRDIDDTVIAAARAAAEEEVAPISDIRAGADYRRHMVGVLFERCLRAALSREPSTGGKEVAS